MKKISFLHLTGAPIARDGEIGFTEGGLPHILSASGELKNEYEIEVICPNLPGNGGEVSINHRGVTIVCLGTSSWVKGYSRMPRPSFYRSAYSYIRKSNPHIVIANNFLASLLLRPLPRNIARIGVIHHLYCAHESRRESGSFHSTVRNIAQFERIAMRFLCLNGIGAISPQVKQALVEEGYPAERIVVVGNGVDPDDYPFSLRKAPSTLIYVGRLAELKGVRSLIDITSRVRREVDDVRLHIVGGGPKEKEIKERARTLGLADTVTLHGYLTEREKIDLLLHSSIYVSNSQFEGFGIPLVEAMATGTVPVVSDIESHRWVFQGERVGYLAKNEEEMADRITHLLKNEVERRTLARNGRKLVQRAWTLRRVSERYRELLSNSEGKPPERFSSSRSRLSGVVRQ